MKTFYQVEERDPESGRWCVPDNTWYPDEFETLKEAKEIIEYMQSMDKKAKTCGYKYRVIKFTSEEVLE